MRKETKWTLVVAIVILAFLALCMMSNDGVRGTRSIMIRPKELEVVQSVAGGWGQQMKTKPTIESRQQVSSSKTSTNEIDDNHKGEWKCCVDIYAVNDLHNHPTAEAAQDIHHNYACPENPSNFSWYYSSTTTDDDPAAEQQQPPLSFDRSKWKKISIIFVGGSTTRQMHEQFKWEMPNAAKRSHHNYGARFLFEHIEVGGCCNYDRSHILDTRKLHHELIANLQSAPDYLVFNVGTWWATKTIGTVIDRKGKPWSIHGTPTDAEWKVANRTTTTHKPDLSFAALMGQAIQLMKDMKHPNTTLVWRSEGTTDCPVGGSFRSSVAPVLRKMQIPVLNISQASCDYLELRDHYDSDNKGPHLCFPSVALRHWLLQFQAQFL